MLAESRPASPSAASCAWAKLCVNMSGANRSIADLRIANLENPGNSGGESNRGRYLRNRKQIFPEERPADNLLRNDDHVAGLEGRGENVRAVPFAGSSSNNGTICANDQDLFTIRNLVGSTCTAEIPACFFTGNV